MTIYLGADHRGFELKEAVKTYLAGKGYMVVDCGNTALDPQDDFPDYAIPVGEKVAADNSSRGVVICGSSGGVCFAANKVTGIRAASGFTEDQVKSYRMHDDVNVLALASDYVPKEKALALVDIFLTTDFLGDEKYRRRIEKIKTYEKKG